MAYPSEDTGFYHLTHGGWTRKDHAPFPADRIETWAYQSECPAEDAKEQVCLIRIWKDGFAGKGISEMLHRRFGTPVLPDTNRNVTLECQV